MDDIKLDDININDIKIDDIDNENKKEEIKEDIKEDKNKEKKEEKKEIKKELKNDNIKKDSKNDNEKNKNQKINNRNKNSLEKKLTGNQTNSKEKIPPKLTKKTSFTENDTKNISNKKEEKTLIKKEKNSSIKKEDKTHKNINEKTKKEEKIPINNKIKELNKENEEYKNKYMSIQQENEKLKEFVDKNKNDIDDIKNNMEQMTQQIETIIKEAAEEKDDPLKNLDLSKYVTKDVFKKASDNIRILTSAINTTTTRDEFEKEIKKINVRLQAVELLQQGVSYGPRTMINSNLVQSGAEPQELYITNSHNPNEIIQLKEIMKFQNSEEIKKLIIATMNEEIKNINILKNPKFSDILNSIAKLEKDIGKNDSSIINIRNILALTPTQNDFINLRQEVERISEESSKKINEIVKTINGEEEDEEEDDKKNALAGYCLNKKINILITRFNDLYSKLISIQNKNNAFSREIKEEVKQNLKTETIKVVEEFKSKLNSFTNKFDNELRMKIDHGGLSVFEDKISNKFRTDLKEKLDKTELKKNNYVIKRKT